MAGQAIDAPDPVHRPIPRPAGLEPTAEEIINFWEGIQNPILKFNFWQRHQDEIKTAQAARQWQLQVDKAKATEPVKAKPQRLSAILSAIPAGVERDLFYKEFRNAIAAEVASLRTIDHKQF
jgi:hypothetical protein